MSPVSEFDGCGNLSRVTMSGEELPTLGSNVFDGCPWVANGTKGILVPVGKADAYKNAEGWSTYQRNITDGTPKITSQSTSQVTEKPGGTVPLAVSREEQDKHALSLNTKLKVGQTGKNINIAWGNVPGADGYDVYVQYCGKKFTKIPLQP